MSMYSPAVSRPSISRSVSPLSMTCVMPVVARLGAAGGHVEEPVGAVRAWHRDPPIASCRLLDVVVERRPVGVDPDRQRPEVPDAEPPEALGHEVLPLDLLDLLDLRRLERGGAADDREVHHPEPAHRLDRLVWQTALAADRPDAVVPSERLSEAHHARARSRTDAHLLVASVGEFADVRRRVEEQGARRGPSADAGPGRTSGSASGRGCR